MKTVYKDNDLIVCIKPSGVFSMDEPGGMPELIRKEYGESLSVHTVHRLDSIVAGLMVYALSSQAASNLSAQISDGSFGKEYLAVVEGQPADLEGQFNDFLYRNEKERKTYATDHIRPDVQEASLLYHVCETRDHTSLVQIKLITGRTHQIRAQFSSRGLPLYGDRKYGARNTDARIALWSCHLQFSHPVTGEPMDFYAIPPAIIPWNDYPNYCSDYNVQDIVQEFRRASNFSDCPYSHFCDGCIYQGLPYDKQLKKKEKLLARSFEAFQTVAPVLPARTALHYRYKAQIFFGTQKNGTPATGYYLKKNRSFLKVAQCSLNAIEIEHFRTVLLSVIEEKSIPVFDDNKRTGWLRSIILRYSRTNHKLMLTLVTVCRNSEYERLLTDSLLLNSPQLDTILININPPSSSSPFGKEETILYGNGWIEDQLLAKNFRISSKTSFPVNPDQYEVILQSMIHAIDLDGTERILDLHCGTGLLPVLLSEFAKRVLAVDVNKDVIRKAEQNIRLNKISNVKMITADPSEYTQALIRSHDSIDIVFINTASTRLTPQCLKAAADLKPQKIVLYGNMEDKLANSLSYMMKQHYSCKLIQSSDSMPYTSGTDTFILLKLESSLK